MQEIILKRAKKHSSMAQSIKRHYQSMLKYLTAKKAANALLAIYEMMIKRSFLSSHPFYIRIEVSPLCNLHCPGCSIGSKEEAFDRNTKTMMSFDLFRKSVEAFLPYLIKVNLYDEGEPLLNNDILEIVRYLHANRVGTCISSNFSLYKSDKYFEDMLSCGLDHLIVALDGATQDSYSRYRIGGNLSLVIKNLERIISLKKKIGSALQIEIQFLRFPHNKDDLNTVRDLAVRLGADRFTVMEDCSTKGWNGLRFEGSEEERRKRGCYQLWVSATINSLGKIGCCDYGEDQGMPYIGLASNYASHGLRNHPSIIALRRSFNNNSGLSLHMICKHCSLYRNKGI